MDERIIPEPSNQKVPRKIVPLPVSAPIPVTAPVKGKSGDLKRKWLIAAMASLLVVAIAATTWWALAEHNTIHYVSMPIAKGAVSADRDGNWNSQSGTHDHRRSSRLRYHQGAELRLQHQGKEGGEFAPGLILVPTKSIVDENRANLAVAEAQLEKDKANEIYTKLFLDRNADLIRRTPSPQDAFDNAKNAHDQALAQIMFDEAAIQQRQASLDAAQVNLDYADIVSPVDGTVVSRNVTMGQTVASSFQTPTLFLIATDLAKMQVDANVSESDIGGIKPGNKATFTVDAYAKRTFRGNGNSGPSISADRSERRDVRHCDQRGQFGPDAEAGHDGRQPHRRRSTQRRDPGAKTGAPLCSQKVWRAPLHWIAPRFGFCVTGSRCLFRWSSGSMTRVSPRS